MTVFTSSSTYPDVPGFADRSGQEVRVIEQLHPDAYDSADCGPMFKVEFDDGTVATVWMDELTPQPSNTMLCMGEDGMWEQIPA